MSHLAQAQQSARQERPWVWLLDPDTVIACSDEVPQAQAHFTELDNEFKRQSPDLTADALIGACERR